MERTRCIHRKLHSRHAVALCCFVLTGMAPVGAVLASSPQSIDQGIEESTRVSADWQSSLSWFEQADAVSNRWLARNPHAFAELAANRLSLRPRVQHAASPAPMVTVRFGDNDKAVLESVAALNSHSHYIPASQPSSWYQREHYARLRAGDVFPGIDIEYYFDRASLEFDFVVTPGANPSNIHMCFEDGQQLRIDDDGALQVFDSDHQRLYRLQPPFAYQAIKHERQPVNAAFVLNGKHVGVAVGDYDERHALVIDPVVMLNTYLGGSGNDDGFAIASDTQNALYVTGLTDSGDFPLASPYQGSFSGFNSLFIAKITPGTPATMEYATFVGSDVAEIRDIAVDSNGRAIVTGSTANTAHPLMNPLQAMHGGLIDTYITQLTPDGSALAYSTFFGGISVDRGRGLNVDNQDNIIVTGPTSSSDLPVMNAAQPALGGGIDAYVAKISADGQTLIFSTYLGGSDFDYGKDVAVDAASNIHVAAYTFSTDLASVIPIQANNAGGADFMLTSFDAGGALQQLSYYGGSDDDFAHGIATLSNGDVAIAGYTRSADFPVSADAPHAYAGDADGVLLTHTPGAASIAQSHLYGGSGFDSFERVNRNAGRVVAAGTSQSPDWPLLAPLQATLAGSSDAVVLERLEDGSDLFASYLGGSGSDNALDVAVSDDGSMHITGATDSSDLAVNNAVQLQLTGGRDAYVISLARDSDDDGIADNDDNCAEVFNPDQADTNGNGIGDVCEPPTITGIWPGDGPPNTVVFVFGSGFVPQQSQVTVNGIATFAVQVVTEDMLLFLLPAGDTGGPVAVTTPHGNTSSNVNFGQPLTGLNITGIWKQQVSINDFVFVFGSGFVPAQTQVTINGINTAVQVVSDGMLIFIVPAGATTGPVTVTTPTASITSTNELVILP